MSVYPPTDRTMLERIIAGEEIVWNEFYQQYAPVIRTLCRIRRVPEAQTEDVVQEVMHRFARNRSTYVYAPERARFRTYFNRIVHGAIADCFRERLRQERSLAELPEPADAAPPEWETAELEAWRSAVLEEILRTLAARVSSRNYLAFAMSAMQGRSIRETADFLGISVPRVYQARSRCTAILKEIIRHHNEADPDLQLQIPGK